jgi:hypothetical protein
MLAATGGPAAYCPNAMHAEKKKKHPAANAKTEGYGWD